jgi:hypothetical protein
VVVEGAGWVSVLFSNAGGGGEIGRARLEVGWVVVLHACWGGGGDWV